MIAYTLLAVIYLMLPVRVIIRSASTTRPAAATSSGSGFTLKYWLEPVRGRRPVRRRGLSLVIASLSTVIATALGTLVAIALERYRFRGALAVNSLIFLPMATPEIIMGASLLTLFVSIGSPTRSSRSTSRPS